MEVFVQNQPTLNYQSKLFKQILEIDDESSSRQLQKLPHLDPNKFSKKERKKSIDKRQKQFFEQNQYRIHAIFSRKANRNKIHKDLNNQIDEIKGSLIDLLDNKSKIDDIHTKSRSKKTESLNLLTSNNKIQNAKDLYQQYLTMQEIEIQKARNRLEKKLDKYLPKNSSFSKYYAQKAAMVDKQARLEVDQLTQHATETKGQTKQDKQKLRKNKLYEILQNKRLDFSNKLRQRSHNKAKQFTENSQGYNVKVTERQRIHKGYDFKALQKQRSHSAFNTLNSPTYSDASEQRNKFQFFPQPKRVSSRALALYQSHSNKSQQKGLSIKHTLSQIQSEQIHETISSLKQISQIETKKSEYLIFQSKKKQLQFEKTYEKLTTQALSAINGYSTLNLQEQTSPTYRKQLMDMWMNTDLNKGKTNKIANSRLMNKRKLYLQ